MISLTRDLEGHRTHMAVQGFRPEEFEVSEEVFSKLFAFEIDGGMTKTVDVARTGQAFVVDIRYADAASSDQTRETFEADGTVTITTADSGIFISSSRSLLADRIRLRRVRFF